MRILADQPRSKFLYIGILFFGLLTLGATVFLSRTPTAPVHESAMRADAVTADAAIPNLNPRISPELLWQTTLGSSAFERASAITLQSNGSILIAGSLYDPGNAFSDSMIFRTLADGSLVAASTLEGVGEDEITSLAKMPDGTIYAAGQKGYAMSVMQLLANGDVAWLKTYSVDGPNIANDLTITNSGDLLVVGATKSQGDGLILRLDDDGNEIWQSTFENGTAYAVTAMADDKSAYGGSSENEAVLIQLDRNGKELWRAGRGALQANRIDALTTLTDGSILTAGILISENGSMDTIVARIDSEGRILWQQKLGGDGDDVISAIKPTLNGAVLVGGTTSTADGSMDMWTLRLDINGSMMWQRVFGGDKLDTAQDVTLAEDGSLLVAGYTFSEGNGENDIWLVHMSAEGALPRGLKSTESLDGEAPRTETAPEELEDTTIETTPAPVEALTDTIATDLPETQVEEIETPEPILEEEPLEVVPAEDVLTEETPADLPDEIAPEIVEEIAAEETILEDAAPKRQSPKQLLLKLRGELVSVEPPPAATTNFSCTFHCQTPNAAKVPFPVTQSLSMASGISLDEANALASTDTELICLGAGGVPDARHPAPTCSAP